MIILAVGFPEKHIILWSKQLLFNFFFDLNKSLDLYFAGRKAEGKRRLCLKVYSNADLILYTNHATGDDITNTYQSWY
ncbi:hypothetical protein D5R40_19370 [Okeania hirsuta]|uniref:Uncharacterized protein n=1 Tax=Okeania hirsuta TaxID=1458930 RepID=A0A3N6NG74_9CYAN|nr:hypothetical protein D4Z78_23420 [Okeania hirsuta]RQH36362.1 hypothetical protein D5R40_19370 [Okeania hirsuta]